MTVISGSLCRALWMEQCNWRLHL